MSNKEIDIDNVIEKYISNFEKSGWLNILKAYLYSDDFKQIIAFLIREVNDEYRFSPPLKHIFRAFYECPYDKLKVIILYTEPFDGLYNADGIALSCKFRKEPVPTTNIFLNAIDDNFYRKKGIIYTPNHDLAYLANQGILLLNTSLTRRLGQNDKHFFIWRSFMNYIIDMLNTNDEKYVWVFLSSKAEYYEELLSDNSIILKGRDPASSFFTDDKWLDFDILSKISKYVKRIHNYEIIW